MHDIWLYYFISSDREFWTLLFRVFLDPQLALSVRYRHVIDVTRHRVTLDGGVLWHDTVHFHEVSALTSY